MFEYNEPIASDELYHYGVLGMKWGVRRGNVIKAYSKASRKLTKLQTKAEKNRKKIDRELEKSNNYDRLRSKIHETKALSALVDSRAYDRKASKWMAKMDKEFSRTKIQDVSDSLVKKGDEYLRKNHIDKSREAYDKAHEARIFAMDKNTAMRVYDRRRSRK